MPTDDLSLTFAALADPTRRAILARLSDGELYVSELAEPFAISGPAVSRHLKVLERAGLVTRTAKAQWRRCQIKAGPLKEATGWLDSYRRFWDESFDRLDGYLQQLQAQRGPAMGQAGSAAADAGRELTLTRTFDLPREQVFELWTSREHLARWWGPKDFSVPHIEQDFRPGGGYRMCIRSPQGDDYWHSGVYRDITPPESIVFSFAWDAKTNEPTQDTLVTVNFAELPDSRTEVTFLQAPFLTQSGRDSHAEGWGECLDKLGAYIDSIQGE